MASAVLLASCGGSAPDPQASFGGASLTVQARDLAFEPDIATAPAGQPLRVILDNKDVGVPHDIWVFQGDTVLGKTPSVSGPGLAAVVLPALAPGRYQFSCTIHPSMIGTIIIEAGAPAGPSTPDDAASPSNLAPSDPGATP
jgi:plastocyanin